MKTITRLVKVVSASLVVTALLVSCGDSTTALPVPSTTVLVYIEGTNLESVYSSAKGNITEMLAAPNSRYLNVVLATGAADKAVAGDDVDNWREVRRYVVNNHKLILKDTVGVVDMGTPQALTDFITWGQANYPADKYVLVFWDHGGGPLGGFGGNDVATTNPSFASNMNIAQLQLGVNNAVMGRPELQFALIGFDACLMATVEVADAFKSLGRYLAASQEIEPGAGWDWTALLTYVASNPNADGAAVGGAIADSYKAKMVSLKDDAIITLSVTDLAKIQRIDTALLTFARDYQVLLAGNAALALPAWNVLASSRSHALDFANLLEIVDTTAMFNSPQILTDSPPQVVADVTELTSATKDAVIKTVSGPYRTSASGLSVMFPSFSVWTPDIQLKAYGLLDYFSPDYRALLSNFSTYARDTVKDLAFAVVPPPDPATSMTGKINSVNPNYEQVYVAIYDATAPASYLGLQPAYSTSGDGSEFSFASASQWFMLNGKLASVIADPTTEKGVQTLKIPMRVDRPAAKDGTPARILVGMYYLLYNFDTDVLVQTIGLVADANNQEDPAIPLQADDLVTLSSYVMPNLTVDPTHPIGYWSSVASAELQFTVGASAPTFAKAVIPQGKEYAFFGFDLRWKPFASTAVALQ